MRDGDSVRSGALSVTDDIFPQSVPADLRTSVGAIESPRGPLLRWHDVAGEHWRRLTPSGAWLDAGDLPLPANVQGLLATDAGYLAAIVEATPLYSDSKLNVMSLSELGVQMGDPIVVGSLFSPSSGMRSRS